MKTTGVLIARFQTPYLHPGHEYLLEQISSHHNRIVVVLGVAPVKGSRRNPYDFYTREKMLKTFSPDLVVLPLTDNASDAVWSRQLDNLLTQTFPSESFLLYGSRDSFIPFYSGQLPVAELPEAGTYSATTIREENGDRVLATTDFRMGINYAYQNTYPKVYPTVDIAILKDDNTQVLLGRKPQATTWRFPGGFVDPEDDCFETAARREMQEECGALETGTMQYIGSARINDWRYRQEADKITTSFFKTQLVYGQPQANDDLDALQWFPVNELEKMMEKDQITPEHHILVPLLLKSL